MTIPIRDVLATLPSGELGASLKDDELQAYLKRHCDREADRKREKQHLLRDALYQDGGIEEVSRIVDQIFKSEVVRERVKKMLPIARFSNPMKRIVMETSTCYAEPAAREVGGSESNQTKYAELVEAMCFDEEMAHINEAFTRHRAVIVAPRVRGPLDAPEVVLDMHSAATARAVMHPNDNTLVVGWLTRCQLRSVRGAYETPAEWLLTTDHEWEFLTKDFRPIPSTYTEHGWGVNRWVAISSAPKSQPDFWPGDDGEDLVSASVINLIVEALMFKETNTASRVPVVSGDTSAMPRGQDLDSASAFVAPEGVSITTVEIGTDIEVFMKAADHALERAGNNYGLSLANLTHQGVQSAEARELMLAPVRERRRKQVKQFRRFERELATVLATVLAVSAPSLAFEAVDWKIDFGEPQVLLSKKERLEIFETERQMGLDNTFSFKQRENPDLTFEQSVDEVMFNIEKETERNVAMRPLQAISGSLGADVPDGATANNQNGKPGGRPPTPKNGASGDLAWVAGVVDAN